MYIPISVIVIAVVCYFLFFRNRQSQSKTAPNSGHAPVQQISNDMYKRGEIAISGLEKLTNLEKDPANKAENETRIKNWNRMLERVKHDDIKLKQVVTDLEVYLKDFRRFSKYGSDINSDDPSDIKENEMAQIRSEEMLTRFKAILGDQYQDPWEEYLRVRKEGEKK